MEMVSSNSVGSKANQLLRYALMEIGLDHLYTDLLAALFSFAFSF